MSWLGGSLHSDSGHQGKLCVPPAVLDDFLLRRRLPGTVRKKGNSANFSTERESLWGLKAQWLCIPSQFLLTMLISLGELKIKNNNVSLKFFILKFSWSGRNATLGHSKELIKYPCVQETFWMTTAWTQWKFPVYVLVRPCSQRGQVKEGTQGRHVWWFSQLQGPVRAVAYWVTLPIFTSICLTRGPGARPQLQPSYCSSGLQLDTDWGKWFPRWSSRSPLAALWLCSKTLTNWSMSHLGDAAEHRFSQATH